MRFCSLGSGSGGNATVIEASQGITTTRVLVDCGFSERELGRRLARAGLEIGQIDALFVTHEHGDHVGCALTVAQRHRLPLWTSRGTWKAVARRRGADSFDASLLHLCRADESLPIGDLCLHPFAVPHDAAEPLQLRLEDGHRRLGVLTDLGSPTPGVIAALQRCDALLLECNHDERLLREGRYPWPLKHRILGTHGHLSNASAAEILAACLHDDLQLVAAAHLSEENNRPALALAALAAACGGEGPRLVAADQTAGLDWQQL